MVEFFECLTPEEQSKYKGDQRCMQVWRAEIKFLECFEDLFDIKKAQIHSAQEYPDALFEHKMVEYIAYYQEILTKPVKGLESIEKTFEQLTKDFRAVHNKNPEVVTYKEEDKQFDWSILEELRSCKSDQNFKWSDNPLASSFY